MPRLKRAAEKKPVVKKAVIKKKSGLKKVIKKKAAAKSKVSSSNKAEKPVKSTGTINEVVIRMYCHGFGDCFLLTYLSNDIPAYRMLIDCGMLTGDSDRLKQCIENIKTDCDNHLDLVVQTHEHKDHISGFNLKDKSKKLIWDSIEVDNVWLAWTENTSKGGDDLAINLKTKFRKKKCPC
ncbi:MAG: MBL fold metallo-hydrolase [Saprospiraceae bacterium]|nr:MBL fold metallo-hydrolase [Saprospiraceae bacterium]